MTLKIAAIKFKSLISTDSFSISYLITSTLFSMDKKWHYRAQLFSYLSLQCHPTSHVCPQFWECYFQTFSNGNMFPFLKFQLPEAPSLPKWHFGKSNYKPKYMYMCFHNVSQKLLVIFSKRKIKRLEETFITLYIWWKTKKTTWEKKAGKLY